MQRDGDMNAEVNKRTQCGWNNWRKMLGVLCDKRVPQHANGNIHNTIILPAMQYGVETVPMTSSHVKKLEVTDMKMCRSTYDQALRYHVRNDYTRERLKIENFTGRCRNAILRWFGHIKRRVQE